MVTTKSNCLNADSKMFCCVQWYLVKTAATQLLVKFILKHYFVKTGPKISIALEKSTDLPLIASPSALWHFIQNMPRKAQTKHLYLSYLRWTLNKYPCIAIFAKFFVFVFVCVFVFVLFKVNEYPWMAIFAKSDGLDQGGCGATLVLLKIPILLLFKLYLFLEFILRTVFSTKVFPKKTPLQMPSNIFKYVFSIIFSNIFKYIFKYVQVYFQVYFQIYFQIFSNLFSNISKYIFKYFLLQIPSPDCRHLGRHCSALFLHWRCHNHNHNQHQHLHIFRFIY